MKEIIPLVEQFKENSKSSLKKYYVIYLIAFGAIALIAFFSQLLIQNYLGKQSEDSYLINVAGKQRMLSQKITKNLSFYHLSKNSETKKLIEKDFNEWKQHHQQLKTGGLIESSYNTRDIDSLFKELSPYFKSMSSAVQSYLDKEELSSYYEVLENEKRYLPLMDEIVNRYDYNYQEKLKFLRRIEMGLSIFLIFMLIIEMLFVFLPLINNLQKVFTNLVKAEKDASDLANNLNQANLRINESSKELSDLNLALDRAVIVIRTNTNGDIIYANDAYCTLTKYNYKELHGKQLFYNNEGGSESIIYSHIKDESRKHGVWQGEVRDTASDGTEFWLDVTIFPIVNTSDELYEYFVICSNITKRKEAEKTLSLVNEKRFRVQEEQQKLNSKAIIEGQETERKRMAVEVHDGLGQMLTALKFTCEALSPENETQQNIRGNMKSLLQDIIKETRRISSDLLPTVLNDFGLLAGIKELIAVSSKSGLIDINLIDNSALNERLSKEKEIAIYRITQEAVNNSMKHSKSNKIIIRLNSDSEYLTVRILDDGVGIDNLDSLINVSGQHKGNGLRNMKERTKLIGGTFYINSSIKKGTEIFVEIPID